MSSRVLLVEDDRAIATVIVSALEAEGYAVDHCTELAGRDALLERHRYGVMLTDVMLGDGDGIGSLAPVRAAHPSLPVIVISAQNTLDTAVRASENEVFEYFPKPFDLDDVVRAVEQAVKVQGISTERGDEAETALPLVGRSQAMQGVFRMITRVLRNDLTVLVLGESGTGKELVAEAIHQLGHRKSGPFIAVNAAAIPRDLIESELFGHEKGAFTGAVTRAIGKFEQANGGTLFLDEIGDMPAEAQTRLLRALQSGRIRRVGGRHDIAVDVRIVAATNRDLAPMIAEGSFREDLYYRLNVVPIELPPLRTRRDDVPLLVRHFLGRAAEEGLPNRRMKDEAIERLAQRRWRGNVRELRNVVYRLALMARDETIDVSVIDEVLGTERPADERADGLPIARALDDWMARTTPADGTLYRAALAAFERPLFEYALRKTGGNQLRAAEMLGINRNTLRKRLSDLEISAEAFSASA
ncbi:response regulator [Erythrobacter sp. 3-20A1M]|uniref:sigma-54-dependent transcriptional regulator n=1 Tax=Erythrobacter sp. 3-20A1M TaxID=2653850 RepID=UPI001BFCAF79|nr:sigma-54 dependent transcriptional regulator [Erythrobacter sp. 3-20A1M]QWC58133.1 response regulator [Erythrobacter sp. 3-20A1M]